MFGNNRFDKLRDQLNEAYDRLDRRITNAERSTDTRSKLVEELRTLVHDMAQCLAEHGSLVFDPQDDRIVWKPRPKVEAKKKAKKGAKR